MKLNNSLLFQEVGLTAMRICVKDLSGSGSKHDPLSVNYVVIGGLYYMYVLFIILLWIAWSPRIEGDNKRKLQ